MALWTPANITTTLWLDADTSVVNTITESGGSVSQWDDKSGNLNHMKQVTAASQPTTGTSTLNSKNVISFANDFMQVDTQITGINALIFVVKSLQEEVAAGNTSPIIGKNATTSTDYTFVYTNSSDASVDISIDGNNSNSGRASFNGALSLTSGGNIDLGNTNLQNEGSGIWYCDWNGGSSVSIDFLAKFTISGFAPTLNGEIAEVVALSTVPSESDRQKLEGYLAWKWGLEANLPIGHPYELAAPTTGATYSQSISSTVSSATSISKLTSKLISNTISSAISITKSTSKIITNTVSSITSVLTSLISDVIYYVNISNTVSSDTTITKSMTKIITNNVSSTLSILKKTTKIIINTVSSVIARVREGVIGVAKYIFKTKSRLRNFTVKKLRTFYYRK